MSHFEDDRLVEQSRARMRRARIRRAGQPDPTAAPRALASVAAGVVAQFALDGGTGAALGHSPRGQARARAVASRVDLALTPPARALVAAGGGHRYAFLLGLPLVAL